MPMARKRTRTGSPTLAENLLEAIPSRSRMEPMRRMRSTANMHSAVGREFGSTGEYTSAGDRATGRAGPSADGAVLRPPRAGGTGAGAAGAGAGPRAGKG